VGRRSAMELVEEIQAKLDALREVLTGDRQRWSWERRWYEVLRAFKDEQGADKELTYTERRAAALRAGMDMRALSGAFPETLVWAESGSTKARLTPSANAWYHRLQRDHPDW
jgi:hypothetical protein